MFATTWVIYSRTKKGERVQISSTPLISEVQNSVAEHQCNLSSFFFKFRENQLMIEGLQGSRKALRKKFPIKKMPPETKAPVGK